MLVSNLKGTDHLRHLGKKGGTILKWSLKKQDVRILAQNEVWWRVPARIFPTFGYDSTFKKIPSKTEQTPLKSPSGS
jgi:hypothetical protein